MTTVLVRRNPKSGVTSYGEKDAGYPGAKARITQVRDDGRGLTYRFPYSPVEVEFDSLGAEYEEIERPGLYALVNRKAPKLLKASFEFRVAHKPTGGLESIQRDLEYLRRIATEDAPVSVVGLGTFFSDTTYLSPNQTNVLFRVYDLSIKVVRRGPNNEPWQADCKIDLIEDRNPIFGVVAFAPIDYTEIPIQVTTNGGSSGNRNSGQGSNNPTPTQSTDRTYSTGRSNTGATGGSGGGRSYVQ